MNEAKKRGTEFPHGATVRELIVALSDVPAEDWDKEVDVMFTPAGVTRAEGNDQPGVIWAFDPFPAMTVDPQPTVACWTIRAMDGLSTAAEVETLRAFQEFQDSPEQQAVQPVATFRDDEAFDHLYSLVSDLVMSDMKDLVRDRIVAEGWAVLDGDRYLMTEAGLDELKDWGS